MQITREEFLRQQAAVRGTGNPQRMHMPLWEELVGSGEGAYAAARRYGLDPSGDEPAGWCFDRFGMTRTRLPDGRIVCIAGEHENSGDPDFFIYNDVIVIAPDGGVEIYGYAPDVFQPTDFHTATLVGTSIYLIGSLGYKGERAGKTTPVYRLDVGSMRIHPVAAGGDGPGWIYGHRAELAPDGKSIRVGSGAVLSLGDAGSEAKHQCDSVFRFDTEQERWLPGDGVVPTLPIEGVDLTGWRPMESPKEAQDLRDAIVREAAPDHPLFCDDYWPMAREEHGQRRVALQMLDGTGRWAICDGPWYMGREEPPPEVTVYPDVNRLAEAAAEANNGRH